jgi:hypothetical protein
LDMALPFAEPFSPLPSLSLFLSRPSFFFPP